MTSNGQPDQSRSSRYVLKDYVNGKLLYCVAPPTVPQETYQTYPARQRKVIEEKSLPSKQQRAMRVGLVILKIKNHKFYTVFVFRSTKTLLPMKLTVNSL